MTEVVASSRSTKSLEDVLKSVDEFVNDLGCQLAIYPAIPSTLRRDLRVLTLTYPAIHYALMGQGEQLVLYLGKQPLDDAIQLGPKTLKMFLEWEGLDYPALDQFSYMGEWLNTFLETLQRLDKYTSIYQRFLVFRRDVAALPREIRAPGWTPRARHPSPSPSTSPPTPDSTPPRPARSRGTAQARAQS